MNEEKNKLSAIINLNDRVSVILTKEGANRLNKLNADIQKHFPSYAPSHLYCEGEEYSTQLWILFDNFGDMISFASNELPFKDNNIIIQGD